MQLVNVFTHYVSGSNKQFENYSDCKVTSVTTFYTKYNKYMMEAVINGQVIVGQYCEEIFYDLKENLGVPRTLVFYRNSKNQLMIVCVPELWNFMEHA